MNRRRSPGPRRGWRLLVAASAVLLLGGAVSSVLLHRSNAPSAVALIRTGPADSAAEGEALTGPAERAPPAAGSAPSAEAKARPGMIGSSSGAARGLAIRLNPAPDSRLAERTRYGLLPKIGPDGARPLEVYARSPSELPGGAKPAGRVAVLISGLGIGQAVTADAIAKLPPAVTLAFSPYGSDLERIAAQAREAGHEAMLQLPMEPFDYPDNDPGPHTLTVSAGLQDNLERLSWVLGRLTGYVGLVNVMGAKLTADLAALAPILKEIGERGLAFLDDGSSSRSVVATDALPAAAGRVPVARAHAVLDAVPRADAIDAELQRLEAVARERGLAIGTASALPVSIDRIARWAAGLETRGILLVPVSGAFTAPTTGAVEAPARPASRASGGRS